MKGKGVRFTLVSEEWAVSYLSKNNNYFRLRLYRTGFSKVEEGPRKGQYANLDFKMLVDLSIIDMLLRYQMLPMTLDIEHFAKVRLLERIEKAGEDGYNIVRNFLASYDKTNSKGELVNSAKSEIRRGSSSPYVAGILAKYSDFDFPAWVFLELTSFGSFIYFYKFCADKFDDKKMVGDFYLLQSVKSLRNACAHTTVSSMRCLRASRCSALAMRSRERSAGSAPSARANANRNEAMTDSNKLQRHCMSIVSWRPMACINIGRKVFMHSYQE